MALIQTAEDILRDEFGLKEENYMKVERERLVSLIEDYNDRDDEIDDLKCELRDMETRNDDLCDGIKDGLSILDSISRDDLVDDIFNKIEKAKKDFSYWL